MQQSRKLVFCLFFLWSGFVNASPDFGPVSMGEFYSALPKAPVAGKLGFLIKYESIATTVSGAQAWKIAYLSSDVNGNKTIVTGIVVAPLSKSDSYKRPIMAWAHGTTGTAQNCGPSQVLDPAQPLNQYFLMNGTSWTDFGLPAMNAFIKAGYVIVATDYQGLGGGGKHQYTVAATQAHDVINSIRAVTQLQEAQADTRAIVYGWSQGGGATLAVAGMQGYLDHKDSVNDKIKILGFVAMAPYDMAATFPTQVKSEQEASEQLKNISNLFSANVFNFTHYAQNLWGMVAAFPELKLSDILTDEGVDVVNKLMARKCMHAASDTLNFNYGDQYKSFLRSDIKNALAWVDANIKGSVNPVTPLAPVIIYWGTNDTTIPPIMGELYFKQMCKIGGQVIRVRLPGNQNHFTTPASAEPLYISWIADRFAGKPVAHVCAELNATEPSF
ncbi:alpha/beta fold hydrolase (plasmid) [Legionella lytica]|uniref:Alpha/beta fold hydrolase n=1 Tax=Legionella lytica TaxID=96232 RepID=A0ABY4YCW3_9GAMM|nr:alpha/beta fold hydrolase [Legionella lytica]USQ15459.1 alpha/beta fold hydrolase [Legionella lytica]